MRCAVEWEKGHVGFLFGVMHASVHPLANSFDVMFIVFDPKIYRLLASVGLVLH